MHKFHSERSNPENTYTLLYFKSKPDVLVIYQAERIVAKKKFNGKPMFMVKWQTYCASENTWEPKAHLPSELLETFENP